MNSCKKSKRLYHKKKRTVRKKKRQKKNNQKGGEPITLTMATLGKMAYDHYQSGKLAANAGEGVDEATEDVKKAIQEIVPKEEKIEDLANIIRENLKNSKDENTLSKFDELMKIIKQPIIEIKNT